MDSDDIAIAAMEAQPPANSYLGRALAIRRLMAIQSARQPSPVGAFPRRSQPLRGGQQTLHLAAS